MTTPMHVLKRETAPRYTRPEGITSYLLASPRTSHAGYLTTTLVEIQPGGEQRIHSHIPEQVYFILEGWGRMIVANETRYVGPGDCVFIPSEQPHGLRNEGETVLRYFSAAAPAFDRKALQSYWPPKSRAEMKGSINAKSTIISRACPDSADAVALITELEAHLEPLYPATSRHGYSVEKLIAQQVAFFVLREGSAPVGCAGIQFFGTDYGEVKRMYVRPQFRGLGYGKLLLDHLADFARAHGVGLLRLETGIHQAAAIRLYEQMGFQRIPPFGDYTEDPLSLCYEKRIR